MTDPDPKKDFSRFVAVIGTGNRAVVPKEQVSIYQIKEGEEWVFQILYRLPDRPKPEVDA